MPHQPTFPEPYLGSIDATNSTGNRFSVLINPQDIITKYNLTIYSVETNSSVYSTGVVTLAEPLYGSLDGTTLEVLVPNTSGMINGKDYNWSIILYDRNNNSISSPLFYFITRTSPVIDFTVDSVLTSCEHTFTATYTQAQNEGYLYYLFSLYADGKLIDTSGEKMDASITYSYMGFLPDVQYRIELKVVTNDRSEYKVSKLFTADYDTQESAIYPIVKVNGDRGCVDLDYSQSIYIAGHTNKTEQYITIQNADTSTEYAAVSLCDGQYVYYNKINETNPIHVPDQFTLFLHENFEDFFSGTIIKLTDEQTGAEYTVRYDGKAFYYKVPGWREAIVDPYVNTSGVHQEKSAIHAAGTTMASLQYDTLYMLYGDDVVSDNSVFLYNDITKNFWWHITILPDRVLFTKGQSYTESVVS